MGGSTDTRAHGFPPDWIFSYIACMFTAFETYHHFLWLANTNRVGNFPVLRWEKEFNTQQENYLYTLLDGSRQGEAREFIMDVMVPVTGVSALIPIGDGIARGPKLWASAYEGGCTTPTEIDAWNPVAVIELDELLASSTWGSGKPTLAAPKAAMKPDGEVEIYPRGFSYLRATWHRKPRPIRLARASGSVPPNETVEESPNSDDPEWGDAAVGDILRMMLVTYGISHNAQALVQEGMLPSRKAGSNA